MRAGLLRFLRKIAFALGLTLAGAIDLAVSVLADLKADGDDSDTARPS